MKNFTKAVLSIRPGSEFAANGTEITVWHSDDKNGLSQPTQEEVDAAVIAFNENEDITEARKVEYELQGMDREKAIDAVLEGDTDFLGDYRAKKAAVKAQHPRK
jgi:hypothetical protein